MYSILKKEVKKDAKLIAHTLCSDIDNPLYENVTVTARDRLQTELLKSMEDKDVLGYYYDAHKETGSEEKTEPIVIVYKIIGNLYKGLRKNSSPRLMAYWGQSKGVEILFSIFPKLYQLGVEEKRLNKEYFTEMFANLNVVELENAWTTGMNKEKIIHLLEQQLRLNEKRRGTEMSFDLSKISHTELVQEMEKAALTQTGVPLSFIFELASDGNLDLFVKEPSLTQEEISKLVDAGWFDTEVLMEFEELEGHFNPFEWHEDTLAQSHDLFQFMLEKTFGEGAKVAGVEELEDYVLLNVAIPNKIA